MRCGAVSLSLTLAAALRAPRVLAPGGSEVLDDLETSPARVPSSQHSATPLGHFFSADHLGP